MYMLNIHHINTNQCLFIYDVFLNKELYNGLLIIHPILTYMTIVFYTLLFNNTYNLKIKNLRLKKVFLNVNKLLKISFLALFLGSL